MDEREQRRAKRRRRAGKDYQAQDLGNGIEMATAEAVMRAVGSLPRDLGWDELGEGGRCGGRTRFLGKSRARHRSNEEPSERSNQ